MSNQLAPMTLADKKNNLQQIGLQIQGLKTRIAHNKEVLSLRLKARTRFLEVIKAKQQTEGQTSSYLENETIQAVSLMCDGMNLVNEAETMSVSADIEGMEQTLNGLEAVYAQIDATPASMIVPSGNAQGLPPLPPDLRHLRKRS
jgi:hypothetical protein